MEFLFKYKCNDEVIKLHNFEGNDDLSFEYKEDSDRYILKIKAKKDIILKHAYLVQFFDFTDHVSFLNGYNSWTYSKEYGQKDKIGVFPSPLVPNFLKKSYGLPYYGDYYFKKSKRDFLHGYDYGYISGENPRFIGSLNYDNAYLIINNYMLDEVIIFESGIKDLELKAGSEFTLFDFLFLKGDINESREKYFSMLPKIKEQEKLIGFCSWYNTFQNIDEKLIDKAIESSHKSYNVFQIDDGYETFVGDWKNVDPKKFPNGLKPLVEKIVKKGLTPGIWVAPFVCETNSDVFKNHQDWICKDKKGKPLKIGSNWSGFYALDFYNPEVQEHIKSSFAFLKEIGFTFFKLDFLYASSIMYRKDKTRAQIARESYKFLREILKDNLINGCGAVIPSSIGLFDYMRIGPDVSLNWDDKWFMKYIIKERVSTKQTMINSIFRYPLNGHYFYNDPDCIILRNENTDLTAEQKEALGLINALFGSILFTSDDLSRYNESRMKQYENLVDVFKNATDKSFTREGNIFHLRYVLNGVEFKYTYDSLNGKLIK